MNDALNSKISFYALRLADQTITADEFKELNAILSSDADAARYYNYFMMTLYHFKERGKEIICDDISIDSILNEAVWKELADYENTAQEIKLDPENPRPELIQKVVYPPREKRKISRFGIFTLLNAAAVVLFFLILRVAPPKGGIEVATVTDSLNAKWVNVKGSLHPGRRLHLTTTPLLLSEGLVGLVFDNRANVIIEGPAEFMILAEDRVGLNYGKIYVEVPEEAVGFSVYTRNAKIIDLGTEFGVAVNTDGDTRLHVITGKTALIVGERSNRVSIEVEAGSAKKIMAESLTVSDISGDAAPYVRYFDSDSGMVWRGQSTLCLADIVGGGNGFGTGGVDKGINPVTGRPAQVLIETHIANNDFRPVEFNPYVDGVFVPDGRTQQFISSREHVFEECPPTNGSCYNNVLNAVREMEAGVGGGGISKTANCLLLHANMGVTYDLRAMRSLLPDVKIVGFQSGFGIEKEAVYPDLSNADFWVLVDGQLRLQKTQVRCGELFEVSLDLSDKDRFLTLVVTEGQDPPQRRVDGLIVSEIHSDWGMFVDPVLILESK